MGRSTVKKPTKRKSPATTELTKLKKDLERVTEQLESRERELTQTQAELREALEHQTATAEVLGIISRSPTARELAEECGVAAAEWEAGPSFFTAPGFCTERLSLFLATELRPAEAAAPDDEELDLSWMTIGRAMAAVESGEIVDAKSIAGILWLARRLEDKT